MRRTLPRFDDLRAFLSFLEDKGQLVRIDSPISAQLEITELHRRLITAGGPAAILQAVKTGNGQSAAMPVVINPFGTVERTAWALGVEPDALRDLGRTLAALRQPRPPRGKGAAGEGMNLIRALLSSRPRIVRRAPSQAVIWKNSDVDLSRLPVQTCWPGEPAPLITWPLVITRAHGSDANDPAAYNLGVYRMQVLGPNKAIVRWLAHRGGAQHFRTWQAAGEDMPIAVAIGADPATIMAAVTPVPETVGEYAFAGLLRGGRGRLAPAVSQPMLVPASAEIVLEGRVSISEEAMEGPYGDHTGYYNAAAPYPVMHISAITLRSDPLYLTTYTGRPPDEPSVMAAALNDVFLPLLQQHFPEIVDFWLPPEGCSYRIGVASIRKAYPGHARRLMLGLWSVLPQFSYTKLLIVVDDDIDARSWDDVMWAVSTRFDPSRDLITLSDTPIDALDFASPREGLGGKMGIDATTKIGAETDRAWGRVLKMDAAVERRVDALIDALNLSLRKGDPFAASRAHSPLREEKRRTKSKGAS